MLEKTITGEGKAADGNFLIDNNGQQTLMETQALGTSTWHGLFKDSAPYQEKIGSWDLGQLSIIHVTVIYRPRQKVFW